jgi:Mitochondrial carrier protein
MQTIGLVGNRNDTALTSLGCASQRPVSASPPTMMSTIRDLYKEQGTRGFWKGVSMNWMKGPVAFSISFTTFDHIQKLMESPKERSQRLPRQLLSKNETIRRDS